MAFEVEDSSGDVYVTASAATITDALVDLARAFTAVVTGGGSVETAVDVDITASARDPPALLVAFINELVFRFDADGFLPGGGRLEYAADDGRPSIQGFLAGETYDPDRHGRGVEVKAATYHGLVFDVEDATARLRVLLDL